MLDPVNLFRANRALTAHIPAAGDGADTTQAGVFTEIRMVEIGGQTLRVGIRRGKRATPPLVVFNGIGANLELLEPFVAALEGIEIVAFDVPGIGGSPAPALPYRYSRLVGLTDRLLETLGYVDQVDVLGLSWGGMLAQQYAYANPQRCRRLILVATSPGSIMMPGRISAIGRLASARRYTDPDHFRRVAPEIYGGTLRRRPDLIDHHAGRARPPHGVGYFYQLAALWGWTSLPWLHRLRQPTLVMAGSDDPIVPVANARLLAQLIRRSQLFVIDDGHLFLITRAREVVPVIQRFLGDPASASPTPSWRHVVGARLARLRQRLRASREAPEG